MLTIPRKRLIVIKKIAIIKATLDLDCDLACHQG
jgi:hypothetical protein